MRSPGPIPPGVGGGGVKLPAQTDPSEDSELEGPGWRASAPKSWKSEGSLPVGTAWNLNLAHPGGSVPSTPGCDSCPHLCTPTALLLRLSPSPPPRSRCFGSKCQGSSVHSHVYLVQRPENMLTFKARGSFAWRTPIFILVLISAPSGFKIHVKAQTNPRSRKAAGAVLCGQGTVESTPGPEDGLIGLLGNRIQNQVLIVFSDSLRRVSSWTQLGRPNEARP